MGPLQMEKKCIQLSRDLTQPPRGGVVGISGWELLEVFYQPNKPCDHKHRDSGDIIFLICCMSSCEHMFKRLCEFMG